jgi:hypothetical protein
MIHPLFRFRIPIVPMLEAGHAVAMGGLARTVANRRTARAALP